MRNDFVKTVLPFLIACLIVLIVVIVIENVIITKDDCKMYYEDTAQHICYLNDSSEEYTHTVTCDKNQMDIVFYTNDGREPLWLKLRKLLDDCQVDIVQKEYSVAVVRFGGGSL